MTVRRTLPARERSFVGAWCFVDHYGPDDVADVGGMDVAPHPHCGLATVTWLFTGAIEHRDSLGTYAVVRPGEVNLMTAGRGIAHSEVSLPETTVLHGVQLWVVLPSADAWGHPRFEHHVPELVKPSPGVTARVFVGSLWGSTSPVRVATPLLGAEVVLAPGVTVEVPVPEGFEFAVLHDRGEVTVNGRSLRPGELGVALDTVGGPRDGSTHVGGSVPPEMGSEDDGSVDGDLGARPTSVVLRAGTEGARVLLLGGEPFGEEVVMWWNFIGRSQEEIVAAREEWNGWGPRFGYVDGYVPRVSGDPTWLPAPGLPGVRLKPRGNRTH